jgi:hypothetical protein
MKYAFNKEILNTLAVIRICIPAYTWLTETKPITYTLDFPLFD